MDSLEDFEKSLAAEKAKRELEAQKQEEKKERKHRHYHRREGSRDRDRDRDKDRHRERHRDRSRDRERHRDKDGESSRRPQDDDDHEEGGHRHKRSRHSRDDHREEDSRHRHREGHRHRSRECDDDQSREEPREKRMKFAKTSDPKEDLPLPDEEREGGEEALVRDSWMTAPSAIDVDYVHRGAKKREPSPPKEEPKRVLHNRELNTSLADPDGARPSDEVTSSEEVSYKFGDEGSQWRMTKLKGVYSLAEQSGRPVDEIAVERFGSLKEFDDAREEKIEMDRRKVYGEGFVGKEEPTGELYKERLVKERSNKVPYADEPEPLEQDVILEEAPRPSKVDRTTLNRLRAQIMKAKMKKSPDVDKLEKEYEAALALFEEGPPADSSIVLDASHSRMLAGSRNEVKAVETTRGRERGNVVANDDMTIDDMVREERRTRGQAGGEGMRLAERIAKDGKFDNDLEYLDENAEKLAKRVHKNETNLKNMAVSEFKKMNRVLDTCPLCHHEDRKPPQDLPIAPILALGTRVYLTLATEPELSGAEGGAVIVPINHHTNLLDCDDDEWEEIRNFMKSLTRLYHDQGREVLFYENAAAPQRHLHAAMVAVPIPWDQGDTAPAFFREAMLSSDEEWSQHKKIIDTGKKAREGLGKLAFRRSIAREMPYFHVWFNLDGGLGHVVEDSERWPRGDLFAREIIGGMLDSGPDVIKKQGRWSRSDPRIEGFKKSLRKFDWTRILTEGQ